MKLAVVGTGISGMVAASLLADDHPVTVFEAGDYIGGHTNTVPVETKTGSYDVDTGFIVYNEKFYPNFTRLLRLLGVDTAESDMSFSVSCGRTGLEYSGRSLGHLFSQRRNLVRPSMWRLLREILRFNREAPRLLDTGEAERPFGGYLREAGYSRSFVERYIVPMGAAIWSTSPRAMMGFPAKFFVRFFQNHGFLSVEDGPRWRFVRGGSHSYVKTLTRPFRDRIRLRCPVERITRRDDGVDVRPAGGPTERYDHVILATHSDQALRLLGDPTPPETEVLGAIPYQANAAVLHSDCSLMPRLKRVWSSWNYHIPRDETGAATLTYHMNSLQRLGSRDQFYVTLNPVRNPRPETVIRDMVYHHPLFTPEGVEAQARWGEISGVGRTHYCGAYWGYGFHEDGVRSGLRVAERFGRSL